jgi:hypothetical protein
MNIAGRALHCDPQSIFWSTGVIAGCFSKNSTVSAAPQHSLQVKPAGRSYMLLANEEIHSEATNSSGIDSQKSMYPAGY